jgi:hypothetical protein
MALIAPFARVTRSTSRSTPDHDDHRMPATERHYRQGLNKARAAAAGDVVGLDDSPFFIDRVEDAVSPGPQAPQILRSVMDDSRGRGLSVSWLTVSWRHSHRWDRGHRIRVTVR